ncbi:MAG: hypothetical protein HY791_13410 [Deltaproteobacteria bacterium]|nr:hypothetical protein [Deltaproteobacteria bacterium]
MKQHVLVLGLLLPLLAAPAAAQEGIERSKHNLSYTGRGVRSAEEVEICKFCHRTHQPALDLSKTAAALSGYQAIELASVPGRGSRSCLACHDGTMAFARAIEQPLVGTTIRPLELLTPPVLPPVPPLSPSLPTVSPPDLRRSHPVGISATRSLESRLSGERLKLGAGNRVECTSCHDPHVESRDDTEGKFLIRSNRSSALCLECHEPQGWRTNPGSHQASHKPFDRELGALTGYGTVADNACMSCHRAHGNASQAALLRAEGAQVCLTCHAGRVGELDIGAEVMKPYAHPVLGGGHLPTEANAADRTLPERSLAAPRHVTCVDCHEPHGAYARPASAPFASGALAATWGIDSSGIRVDPIRFEYELCFKCHGDSMNQPARPRPPERLRRAIPEPNLRRAFDPESAASFHPVVAPGRGRDVPSLIPPLTPSSLVYCTDCHGSDRRGQTPAGGPRGPHGSIYRSLLERNLSTSDHAVESPTTYALCYKCHDREAILSPTSPFDTHGLHVVRERTPCTACHASHGVSGRQGDPLGNAHLIDFDVSIVAPAGGRLSYRSLGPRSGSCSVSCHGTIHVETAYPRGT